MKNMSRVLVQELAIVVPVSPGPEMVAEQFLEAAQIFFYQPV
jgi:hypothetical protein